MPEFPGDRRDQPIPAPDRVQAIRVLDLIIVDMIVLGADASNAKQRYIEWKERFLSALVEDQ